MIMMHDHDMDRRVIFQTGWRIMVRDDDDCYVVNICVPYASKVLYRVSVRLSRTLMIFSDFRIF